jgi:hypothetical protein
MSTEHLTDHPEIEERDAAATLEVPVANEQPIVQASGDHYSILSIATDNVDTQSQWVDKIATNVDMTVPIWNEPRTTDDSIRGMEASGINPETGEERVAPYKRRNTEYPYNNVIETESGHIREMDDTPFAERIYEKHRTGTYYEIDADGNKVTRIVGQKYEIVAGSEFVNIKGDVNLTVDGNMKTYIKGDWNIQVDGNKYEVVKGDVKEEYASTPLNWHMTTVVGFREKTIFGLENENIVGAILHVYGGIKTETVVGTSKLSIVANYDVDAARIDLN